MKRLLILVAVLALVSIANANEVRLYADTGPQMTTVDVWGEVTIIVAGPADNWSGYLDIFPVDCSLSSPTDVQILPDAGDMSSGSTWRWETAEGGYWESASALIANTSSDPEPGEEQIAGDHFSTTIECGTTPVETCAVVALFDPLTYCMMDEVTLRCVPEPATIALLGLGGLMLRRRKIAGVYSALTSPHIRETMSHVKAARKEIGREEREAKK